MNKKQYYEKKIKSLKISLGVFAVLIVMFAVVSAVYNEMSNIKQSRIEELEQVNEEIAEYFIFAVGLSQYCAEFNNVSQDFLLDAYMEVKLQEVLNDTKDKS